MEKMEQIMELQRLQEQMETLSKQLEELQEKQGTISITLGALKELKETKNGTEILAPIADGIFVKTILDKNDTAVVNIGKGITVEKSIPQVIEMVKSHESNISKSTLTIEEQMQQISNTLLEKIAVLEMQEK